MWGTFAETLVDRFWEFPNLVVLNLVVCNFSAEAPFCAHLRAFALFCRLAFALFCAPLRSFALICMFLRPTAFRATAFGNCRGFGECRDFVRLFAGLLGPATAQNLVVKFDGEVRGGVLVENASDVFPSKRSSKISFQTSPEVRRQFRRKLRQLHSGNRWCLDFAWRRTHASGPPPPAASPRTTENLHHEVHKQTSTAICEYNLNTHMGCGNLWGSPFPSVYCKPSPPNLGRLRQSFQVVTNHVGCYNL